MEVLFFHSSPHGMWGMKKEEQISNQRAAPGDRTAVFGFGTATPNPRKVHLRQDDGRRSLWALVRDDTSETQRQPEYKLLPNSILLWQNDPMPKEDRRVYPSPSPPSPVAWRRRSDSVKVKVLTPPLPISLDFATGFCLPTQPTASGYRSPVGGRSHRGTGSVGSTSAPFMAVPKGTQVRAAGAAESSRLREVRARGVTEFRSDCIPPHDSGLMLVQCQIWFGSWTAVKTAHLLLSVGGWVGIHSVFAVSFISNPFPLVESFVTSAVKEVPSARWRRRVQIHCARANT